MDSDIFCGETEDLSDPVLCIAWERQLLDRTNTKSPSGFLKAIQNTFPAEVMLNWDKHCWGNRRRSWVGIKTSAKQMHLHADFEFQILNLGDVHLVHTAAQSILLALPQIHWPGSRDRESRLLEEQVWEKIDFCRLCWRLTSAGGVSRRRQPTCEHHKTRSNGYQRNFRLLPQFKESFRQTRKRVGTFAEWEKKVSEDKFPHLDKHIRSKVSWLPKSRKGDSDDLEIILKLLLLDIQDPKNKIRETIDEWLNRKNSDYSLMLETFLFAETWLSLISSKQHGGNRKSKKSGACYPPEFKEKSVKQALKANFKAEIPFKKTAQKIGVKEHTLYTWINKFREECVKKVVKSNLSPAKVAKQEGISEKELLKWLAPKKD